MISFNPNFHWLAPLLQYNRKSVHHRFYSQCIIVALFPSNSLLFRRKSVGLARSHMLEQFLPVKRSLVTEWALPTFLLVVRETVKMKGFWVRKTPIWTKFTFQLSFAGLMMLLMLHNFPLWSPSKVTSWKSAGKRKLWHQISLMSDQSMPLHFTGMIGFVSTAKCVTLEFSFLSLHIYPVVSNGAFLVCAIAAYLKCKLFLGWFALRMFITDVTAEVAIVMSHITAFITTIHFICVLGIEMSADARFAVKCSWAQRHSSPLVRLGFCWARTWRIKVVLKNAL